MEVKKTLGFNIIALALILFLLITSNSGLENEWHYIRNRRNVAAPMERDLITPSKAANPYIDGVKNREKRFVFLLPLVPLFGGLTAGTVAAAGAAVVGTAAVATVIQNGPLEMPRFRTSYSPSSTTMEARKPKSSTENDKQPESTGPKKAPKTDEINAFDGLTEAKRKTPVQGGGGLRPRWKDGKGKIYEWDSKKGELEVYDKRGKNHEGGFDPYAKPPKRISDPVPGRTVEP